MVRSRNLKVLAFACLVALVQAAFGYEPDTHFQMTYVICRVAGFTAPEALQIASADQGMDDSPDCLANGGIGGIIPNVQQEWLWHAFDHDGKMGPKGVLDRKERMFHAAETAPGHSLVLLGVFFHYQQDTWAHRHHYDKHNLSYDTWTTYNTPFGHAKDVHQPDRPPFDPVCALICAEDMLRYAHSYLADVLHRPQGKFLANYVPSQETTQAGWSENNDYFHQLAINGAPGSPRRFLIDLIRTQIAAYSKSVDPRWGLHKTSDIMSDARITERLNWCCGLYKAQLGTDDLPVVPLQAARYSQHCDHMTTDGLIKMGMPGN
jgi:hypothetical protein